MFYGYYVWRGIRSIEKEVLVKKYFKKAANLFQIIKFVYSAFREFFPNAFSFNFGDEASDDDKL